MPKAGYYRPSNLKVKQKPRYFKEEDITKLLKLFGGSMVFVPGYLDKETEEEKKEAIGGNEPKELSQKQIKERIKKLKTIQDPSEEEVLKLLQLEDKLKD